MPAPWVRSLKQVATLWESGETFDDYGRSKRTAGAPVEIPCRWNDDTSTTTDASGEPVALSASVLVAREVAVGSIMRLGTIAEYNAAVTARGDLGLLEVVRKSGVPDLRNIGKARTLSLTKFRDDLPTEES